jgi:hypothetical protein
MDKTYVIGHLESRVNGILGMPRYLILKSFKSILVGRCAHSWIYGVSACFPGQGINLFCMHLTLCHKAGP